MYNSLTQKALIIWFVAYEVSIYACGSTIHLTRHSLKYESVLTKINKQPINEKKD